MTLTPEQIRKYSELMAGFEGWEQKENFVNSDDDEFPWWVHNQTGRNFHNDFFPYHTDYNWLMRVWVKFRDMNDGQVEWRFYIKRISPRIAFDTIEEAFLELGKAIEWYQNLKSTP